MFDGEQFHQFITSSRTSSLPISLSFPLHGSSPPPPPPPPPPETNFLTFDPLLFPSHHHHQTLLPSHLLPLQSPCTNKFDEDKQENRSKYMNWELGRFDLWSNDEVLALLRIKSSLENWFPDFTWDHVSRKLAEIGYRRSAEKCKEKFEEETCKNFNAIAYNKNSRFLINELDEHLYHGENHHPHYHVSDPPEKNQCREEEPSDQEEEEEEEEEEEKIQGQKSKFEEDPQDILVLPSQKIEQVVEKSTKNKKRKRKNKKKFEMFKGLCVDIVNKMMAQLEEMQNKLLEDMVYRDEQKIAREEAWKKQEMERFNKEIEIRAQEQVIAGDRQSTIIEFLKKITSDDQIQFSFGVNFEDQNPLPISSSSNPSATIVTTKIQEVPTSQILQWQESCVLGPNSYASQNSKYGDIQNNPLPKTTTLTTNISEIATLQTMQRREPCTVGPTPSVLPPASQNPKSGDIQNNPLIETTPTHENPTSTTSNGKEFDTGKRWPRDEVLALINMRCSLNSGSTTTPNNEDKGLGGIRNKGGGGSLWERISQGMLELGYKRSAKRCKEKWENINKYFRKTKDVNKKRSVDSRTCPYFHQLSSLYNHQGTLVPAVPADEPENCSAMTTSPENHPSLPETAVGSTQDGSSAANMHVQEAALEF